MTRRPPQSEQAQSDLAERMASDFEAVPLHNKVYDDLQEDDQLARLLDAEATANAAGDLRVSYHGNGTEFVDDIDDAVGTLGHIARQRALEAVAESCATVITDSDQWVDEGHWEQTAIDGAKHEAREWLQLHTDDASRAGVLEVLD